MKNILPLIALIFILAGCSTDQSMQTQPVQNQPGTPQEQSSAKLSVVASFYPLAFIAERIGAENVIVTNLVGAADPHDYTLSPRDIQTMQEADVVLLQGAGLEPWGADIESQLSSSNVRYVVVTDSLTLTVQDEDVHSDEVDEHDDDHHSEEEHDDHGGGDKHDHGGVDPHTWLDPILAKDMVDSILQAFVAADQTNAEMFRANADMLKNEFDEIDNVYSNGLSECVRNDVIVSHDAFNYLAQRYEFTTHAIAGISTQDEPSAKTLAALKAEAQEGITHILAEENSVNRFAQTLSRETGLTMLPINALSSPSEEGIDFFDRARTNLSNIQIALGCNV